MTHSEMLKDLLSCLPYDIIYFILDGLKPEDDNDNDTNASATSLFSALKGMTHHMTHLMTHYSNSIVACGAGGA